MEIGWQGQVNNLLDAVFSLRPASKPYRRWLKLGQLVYKSDTTLHTLEEYRKEHHLPSNHEGTGKALSGILGQIVETKICSLASEVKRGEKIATEQSRIWVAFFIRDPICYHLMLYERNKQRYDDLELCQAILEQEYNLTDRTISRDYDDAKLALKSEIIEKEMLYRNQGIQENAPRWTTAASLRTEAICIREWDAVNVRVWQRYTHYRDLGAISESDQDPLVTLVSWTNGGAPLIVPNEFKVVPTETKHAIDKCIDDLKGDGKLRPVDAPKQCWDGNFLRDKDNTTWSIFKKLTVFEKFIIKYANAILPAEVTWVEKDGFLILMNPDYGSTLRIEYDVCMPLLGIFATEGREYIDILKSIPIIEIESWIDSNYKELYDWLGNFKGRTDQAWLNIGRIRRVLISLLPYSTVSKLLEL